MATEEVKSTPDLQSLFTQLAEPFDPSEIKWRVTHTTRDGSRGAVIAFRTLAPTRTGSTNFSPLPVGHADMRFPRYRP